MSRKNSTRNYWHQHYQSFKELNITQREYCRQNNLGYWTFNKWKRLFDQENNSTSLQQLPVTYHPVKTDKLEITLPNNVRISIPEDFSEKTLRQIISVMRNDS